VGVDEARHDDGLSEVDELRAGVAGAQLIDAAHGDDAPAVDGHGAALQEGGRDREDPVGIIVLRFIKITLVLVIRLL
jgi:hypothetical protein